MAHHLEPGDCIGYARRFSDAFWVSSILEMGLYDRIGV